MMKVTNNEIKGTAKTLVLTAVTTSAKLASYSLIYNYPPRCLENPDRPSSRFYTRTPRTIYVFLFGKIIILLPHYLLDLW